ncbi:2-hydroxyacid dehydrogenase [Streptomyces sp. MMS24-I2-30]|uniref:2-hydroxyacid dehydrogenase n=1 Tax=Streptomyces sp. MMS24-I2-30 TaxID=3351564 RepID=UPI003896E4A6
MNDGRTVWLPYRPERIAGLPDGLVHRYWDGSDALPGDPADVGFLVGLPAPGAERPLARVLPLTRNLDVLQLLSSGHEHILPLVDRMPPGLRVSTGRGVHGGATAELAVTLLLALSRGIDGFVRRQPEGVWAPAVRHTLLGKRVLVVGYGAVGTAVADRLRPFGCQLVPVARTARSAAGRHVHSADDLPALLPTADAVVLCAPLTDRTHHMLGSAELALLPDGAILVNVGRGELVDTEALTREVRGGRLRAGLDVTDPEPLPAGHPLWRVPDALITPHVAAFTDAFASMTEEFLLRQLHRYARGEAVENVVLTVRGQQRGRGAGAGHTTDDKEHEGHDRAA